MFQLNPDAVAAKQVGNLFISDIAVGITLVPNIRYDLNVLYGEDTIASSRELKSAIVMGWVIETKSAPAKKPLAPFKIVPIAESVVETEDDMKKVSQESARMNVLFDLAIRSHVIVPADNGSYSIMVQSGSKDFIRCKTKAVVIKKLSDKVIRDNVRAKLL